MIMKTKLVTGALAVLLMMVLSFTNLNAQDEEKTSPFSVGTDFVSSYVWRGSKIGTGPNIQPSLKYTTGGLTLGAWGSFSLHQGLGIDVAETDLYASYAFDFGLSLGVTDYYYTTSPFFQFSGDTASHAFEINLGYVIKSLSLSANYIVNDASAGGPANKPGGGDMYFEANYAFENFGVFVGAGNGWHTTYKDNGDDVFAVCNIGLKASKEIKVSDTFSIPVSGALSVNPDKEQLNLVVGFSF
jgi:hypothetical protein